MEVTDAPRDEDLEFLDAQISAFNIERTGARDYRPLASFVRDGDGRIVAGISGFIWGGWFELKLLWVHESRRGRGVGSQLLAAIETEASRAGCRGIWLDSYAFQAPGFYQRHGYDVFGELVDYPPPHQRVFLQKRL